MIYCYIFLSTVQIRTVSTAAKACKNKWIFIYKARDKL